MSQYDEQLLSHNLLLYEWHKASGEGSRRKEGVWCCASKQNTVFNKLHKNYPHNFTQILATDILLKSIKHIKQNFTYKQDLVLQITTYT